MGNTTFARWQNLLRRVPPLPQTQSGAISGWDSAPAANTTLLSPAQGIAGGRDHAGESPQGYAIFPYGLFSSSSRRSSVVVNNVTVPQQVAIDTISYTLNPVGKAAASHIPGEQGCNVGWCQDVLFLTALRLSNGTKAYGAAPWQMVKARYLKGTSGLPLSRFPTFYNSHFDGTAPEEDHGAVARIALQMMALQWDQDSAAIYVLPAWPLDVWPDVHFKLLAPNATSIEVKLVKGKVALLTVTPSSRQRDVVLPPGVDGI
eukprot:COSAG01_NODE_1648_length_9629_cov_9.733998_11_plen_260_part_00